MSWVLFGSSSCASSFATWLVIKCLRVLMEEKLQRDRIVSEMWFLHIENVKICFSMGAISASQCSWDLSATILLPFLDCVVNDGKMIVNDSSGMPLKYPSVPYEMLMPTCILFPYWSKSVGFAYTLILALPEFPSYSYFLFVMVKLFPKTSSLTSKSLSAVVATLSSLPLFLPTPLCPLTHFVPHTLPPLKKPRHP